MRFLESVWLKPFTTEEHSRRMSAHCSQSRKIFYGHGSNNSEESSEAVDNVLTNLSPPGMLGIAYPLIQSLKRYISRVR